MSFDIDWTEHLLGEVCQITDCLHSTAPTVDYKTSFRMLRTSNIRNGRILSDDAKYVTEETYEAWTVRGKLEKDDVILTREAPMGEVGIIKSTHERYFLGQRMLQLRANRKKILPDFLYYSLLAPELQNQIKMHEGTGSVVSNIRIPALKKFKIRVPSIEIQEAVVGVLRGMDKKIDLNNAINKNLEEIAQALFKRWFVDFEFPNEYGEPYKSSGGEFEESELGLIPKGWEIKPLKSVCDFRKGFSYKGAFLSESGIPMVNLGNVAPDGNFKFASLKYYTNESFKDHHTIKPGDIVIANTDITQKRDVLGTPIIVPDLDTKKIIFSHHLTALKNLKIPSLFVYHLLKTDSCKNRLKSYATGTTVLALPKDALPDFQFVNPTAELIDSFNMIVTPIYRQIGVVNKESRLLQFTRDTLLPKLMSGEIRVPVERDHNVAELPKVAESSAIYQP